MSLHRSGRGRTPALPPAARPLAASSLPPVRGRNSSGGNDASCSPGSLGSRGSWVRPLPAPRQEAPQNCREASSIGVSCRGSEAGRSLSTPRLPTATLPWHVLETRRCSRRVGPPTQALAPGWFTRRLTARSTNLSGTRCRLVQKSPGVRFFIRSPTCSVVGGLFGQGPPSGCTGAGSSVEASACNKGTQTAATVSGRPLARAPSDHEQKLIGTRHQRKLTADEEICQACPPRAVRGLVLHVLPCVSRRTDDLPTVRCKPFSTREFRTCKSTHWANRSLRSWAGPRRLRAGAAVPRQASNIV